MEKSVISTEAGESTKQLKAKKNENLCLVYFSPKPTIKVVLKF
jgi:hypothetical protein